PAADPRDHGGATQTSQRRAFRLQSGNETRLSASVRYECPAPLAPRHTEAVREAAMTCWQALGCRDVCRLDFRLRDGVPYFLEANPLPGLNPTTGDIVLLANGMGISHAQLVERIVSAAMESQTGCYRSGS